jgi:hypothetical protein
MNKSRFSIASIPVMALLISSCATTQLTSDWKNPTYHGQPQKILVIAVAKKPANKRIFEDEFVRQLKARGVNAVASYTLMPDNKQSYHAAIAAQMKEHNADAVLISRLVSKKTVQTYIPGTVNYQPSNYSNWRHNQSPGSAYYPPNYGNWRDYYGHGYQAVYTPGYMAEDEYAIVESNLYDAKNDKLIWSAESETEIMGSDQTQIKSYIGVMVDTMAEQKLLK